MLLTTILPFVLIATAAATDLERVHKTPEVRQIRDLTHLLYGRQTETCRSGTTCAACFGAGNVPCSSRTCFNPSDGEQCCADGKYCIGATNACCGSTGAGRTGAATDILGGATATATTRTATTATARTSSVGLGLGGASGLPSLLPSGTTTGLPASQSTWTCRSTDSNEDCCQRGGSSMRWCSGDINVIQCYSPLSGEYCCSNGEACTGTGCCSALGAVSITPNQAIATSRPASSSATRAATTPAGGSNSLPTGSSFSGNGAGTHGFGGAVAVVGGIAGVVAML